MEKVVLAIVPHPDDAEFYAGGTLAKFCKDGAKVHLVTTTDGAKGSFDLDKEILIATRRREALNAGKVLGVESVIMLGYSDFELDRVSRYELREQYIRLIRQIKPDVLIAEDYLYVQDIHPDHQLVARVAAEAVAFANLPLLYPEHKAEGLDPHFTPEKYFYTEDLKAANKIVDISDTFEIKMAALCEHKSQISFLVEDILRQAQIAGVDLKTVAGDALDDPNQAMRLAMQISAAQAGEMAGYPLGEAFRVVRFHPIVETLLNDS